MDGSVLKNLNSIYEEELIMKARVLGMTMAGVVMAGMLSACGTESAAGNEEVSGVIGYLCL